MGDGITVLICSYNDRHYLPDILKTVQAQTVQPDEILIVDDGSDPAIEIERISRDGRVRVIRHRRNLGLAAARNTGIRNARHPFVALLDTDDRWEPTKLARQQELLADADPHVFGVFTGFLRTGRKLRAGTVRTPQVEDWHRFFMKGIRSGPGSTLMFRKEAALSIDPFDERMRRYEDWDWLLNVTRARRHGFLTIDEPLANVTLSGRPSIKACRTALDLIEKKHLHQLETVRDRNLFRAALHIERAAVAKWEGSYASAFGHALQALTAPRLVWSEIRRTLNRT